MDEEKTKPEDEHRDRPFNPDRLPRSDNVIEIILDVLNQVQNYEELRGLRKRKRKQYDQARFEAIVTAIVCDLIQRHLTKPGDWLAISLSKQVLSRKGRYDSPIMSKTLPDILERMSTPEMAFVEMEKGNPRYTKTWDGRQTRIRAGEKLVSRIFDHEVTLYDLRQTPSKEVVILRAHKPDNCKDAKEIDYQDNRLTKQYRREVEAINDWLADADIDLDELELNGRLVDPGERRLRRIFNNGSFEAGGRLNGGFWQDMKKKGRNQAILIQGEGVVTLDYSQMAPTILYGLKGCQPTQPDAYILPGLEKHRGQVKQVFNALLFKQKPTVRFPAGTRGDIPTRYKFSYVKESLCQAHEPIKHHFDTEIGYYVMFRESEILVDVLLALQKKGIVGLPIHDAVVVPRAREDEVREIMVDVFQDHMGIPIRVERDG